MFLLNNCKKQTIAQLLFLLVALGSSFLYGFDYKVDGDIASVSRIGLSNNKHIDKVNGIYPNNSFWSLTGTLGITMQILDSDTHDLKMGFRGIVGGVALDTTRNGADWFPSDSGTPNGNLGEFNRTYMPAWGEIINAYLSYIYKTENTYTGFKLGRYEFEGTDWWSLWNEGAEIFWGNKNLKAYTIYTYRRSSSAFEKLNHFDPRNLNVNLFGIFVFGLDSNFNIGEKQNLFVRPYIYYQPGAYFDPGFKIVWDTNKDKDSTNTGINFKTTFLMLFAIHDKRAWHKLSDQDWGYEALYDNDTYLGRTHGKGGTTLFLREDVLIDNYNTGMAIYKNFGNPNDMIGSYGDPTGLNTWVYTAYSTAATWSDFFSQDAFNAYIFGGGKYTGWSWDIIARTTYAPRANENSVALLLSYDFTKNINLNLRLEWAGTLDKAGYKLFETYLTKNVYTDKSMIFWYLVAKL